MNKTKYSVSFVDYDGIDKTEDFDDLKEALNFIENGLHFVREFTIRKAVF